VNAVLGRRFLDWRKKKKENRANVSQGRLKMKGGPEKKRGSMLASPVGSQLRNRRKTI